MGGKIHFPLPHETVTEENLSQKVKLLVCVCVCVCVLGGGGVGGLYLDAGDLFVTNKWLNKTDKT